MASSEEALGNPMHQLTELKEYYINSCKIIHDVGEYAHVCNIRLFKDSVTVKLQLAGDLTVQNVMIQCKNMKVDCMKSTLQKDTLQKSVSSSLLETVKHCEKMLIDQGWSAPDETESPKSQRRKKTKQRKKKAVVDEVTDEKKPSMKTAGDVLSRIFWDEALDVEDFVIGYLDRFVGIVEKPITAFSWDDIASVDYNTLAIPKHRICYFKYKNMTVWDKEKRLDLVFGSTGSSQTITDVIKSYEETSHARNESSASKTEENSDDEDIEITCTEEENPLTEDGLRRLTNREMYWGPKLRPTHFIALRITNPDIVHEVHLAQKTITAINPEYQESLIPLEKLHITLACLGLDNDAAVAKCIDAVHTLQKSLSTLDPAHINLKIEGVDHFFNNCMYAKVEDCSTDASSDSMTIRKFVQHLRAGLQEQGVDLRDVFDFVPHMTLFKMSRQFQSDTYTHYMDMRVIDSLKDKHFGYQPVSNMHLCVMSSDRQADGFYVTHAKIEFA